MSWSGRAEAVKAKGYSLQANKKTREGSQHPDRDAQFQHISQTVSEALAAGEPVISVDAKKRELIGDFKAVGREFQPKGRPVEVRGHDFKDKQLGHAIPYGVSRAADPRLPLPARNLEVEQDRASDVHDEHVFLLGTNDLMSCVRALRSARTSVVKSGD